MVLKMTWSKMVHVAGGKGGKMRDLSGQWQTTQANKHVGKCLACSDEAGVVERQEEATLKKT
jgi:hypothetical protein